MKRQSQPNPGKWAVFSLVAVGIFMSTLDGSIVNIALPAIMADLGASLSVIEWVMMIYLFIVSSLLLSFGRLSDIRGRRWVYSRGLIVFSVGSLLCATAHSAGWLIGARAFQGLGAAMIMSCTPALVIDIFPLEERGKAMGMVGAVVASGLTVGPALGGWLLHIASWPLIFYINIPIGLANAVVVNRWLKGSHADLTRPESFDLAGAFLLAFTVGCFLLAMTHAYAWGYGSWRILGLFGLSGVGLIALGTWLIRTPHPVIEPSIWRIRLFTLPVIAGLLLFVSLFMVVFLMPFYLMHPQGMAENRAGLIMVTLFVFLSVFSPLSGTLSDRMGTRFLCTLGMGILALALYQLSWLSPEAPLITVISRLALAGIGTAVFISPNSAITMSAVPPKYKGVAAATVATARNLGMVLGIAVAGAIFNSVFYQLSGGQDLRVYSPELEGAFMNAFHYAMLTGAGIALLNVAVCFLRGRETPVAQGQRAIAKKPVAANPAPTDPPALTGAIKDFEHRNPSKETCHMHKPFRVQAVLFDFDGTLTWPGALDLGPIKSKLGCPPDQPILEFISRIPDSKKQSSAHALLDAYEMEAAAQARPNDGAEALLKYLRQKGLKLGILSRNTRAAVHQALQNFEAIDPSDFDIILSRSDPIDPKPSPDGVIQAAKRLGVPASEILVVGDFIFDIQAGQGAGATTVYLDNADQGPVPQSDFQITALKQAEAIVRLGLPMAGGKFPNDLLKRYLENFDFHDPSVLINPGIGEDTAAICMNGQELLILKSDPITFATDAIGQYAVLVNANDIATSGADPRWLLTTLLFPPGTTPSEGFAIMEDLKNVCKQWGITLCGGHTEITDAVTRPVVSATLTGTVERGRLIDKGKMKTGDTILLTKAVSVEGTSIIAREFSQKLARLGLSGEAVETAKGFLSKISILDEARIARDCPGTTAMHDVTEGGLATATEELSIAGNHRIRVWMEKIPVFEETRHICKLLGLDPLGLIGSGSLLIACDARYAKELMETLEKADIPVACIGEVLESGQGVEALKHGNAAEWPRFEVDEIARLF